MRQKTRAQRSSDRLEASPRGPRCVASGGVQMTDICGEVRTLSEMLLLCERRFAESVSTGDEVRAEKWAAAGHAVLAALRPNAGR